MLCITIMYDSTRSQTSTQMLLSLLVLSLFLLPLPGAMLQLAKACLGTAQSKHFVHWIDGPVLSLHKYICRSRSSVRVSTAGVVQANAVSLSAELPQIEGGTQKVLYPSSAKAGSDLQVRFGQRNPQPVFQMLNDMLELQRVSVYICHPTSSATVPCRLHAD